MSNAAQYSAIIAGVGPALGSALCQTFSRAGYQTLGLSRSVPSSVSMSTSPQYGNDIQAPAASVANSVRKTADAADFSSLKTAIDEFQQQARPLKLAVYNAAKFMRAPFEDTAPQDFIDCYKTNVLGAVHFAKLTIPALLKAGGGTLIFTGATASLRGGDGFSAFASSKFALRGLAQSLARTYQKQGIHIAHVVLDGAIAGSEASAPYRRNEADALQAADIAKVYLDIAGQPRSSWTHELDLRPFAENF